MNNEEIYQSKRKSLDEFLELIQSKDSLGTSIAGGQPQALLNHLSNKKQIEDLKVFTGLLAFPYPILSHPNAWFTSGYYGPIERMANEAGFHMAYMPLAFNDFELYVSQLNPRVVMTTLSPMDANGYLSFGINAEASYEPMLKAGADPKRLAIAQVNLRMPWVGGLPELGDNKIHISELDAVIEQETPLLELPVANLDEAKKKIAENVADLIRDGDTLQFGIGAIPDEVARLLASSPKGDFKVHSELVSDGFLTLMEAGKIIGTSILSFALGTQKLYDWLDEKNGKNRRRALAAPVSYVNSPARIAKIPNMTAVNSGFMVDFSGQICSEAIGERQYSGVGGQFNFVQGAFHSPGGKNILCIRSSAVINGKRYSNIVDSFPAGSIVSTPRHYAQWIVTEYGSVNLFGLSDEERPEALIPLAHPEFRDNLKEMAKQRDKENYKRSR